MLRLQEARRLRTRQLSRQYKAWLIRCGSYIRYHIRLVCFSLNLIIGCLLFLGLLWFLLAMPTSTHTSYRLPTPAIGPPTQPPTTTPSTATDSILDMSNLLPNLFGNASNVTIPTGPYTPPMFLRVFQAFVLFIIMIGSICGNLLVLASVFLKRSLRNRTGLFIVNLAIADTSNGIINFPYGIVSSITRKWIFGAAMCKLTALTNSLFCATSILTLTMVSLDRYVAITDPFHYRQRVTKRVAAAMLGSTWMYALAMSSLPLFGWGTYEFFPDNSACTFGWQDDLACTLFVTVTVFCLPLNTTLWAYYHIFKTANRQARAMAKQEAAMRNIASLAGIAPKPAGDHNKAAKTLFTVLGVFLVCWSPFFTQNMIGLITGPGVVPGYITSATVWFAYTNSACNPFIYGLMNMKYRQAFKEVLGKLFNIESWARPPSEFLEQEET